MANTSQSRARVGHSRRFDHGGYLLGFGFGGFFDGILLHQILQWHHLLISIQTGFLRDPRGQVLADGLFHALMYVVAAVGLWMLFHARGDFAGRGAERRLLANLLIGFGMWHAFDAVLSHWLLGIHRIRMGVDNPLVYDVIWLVVFGIVPLALGLAFRRRNDDDGDDGDDGDRTPGDTSRATATMLLLAIGSAAAGSANLWPMTGDDRRATVAVLLRPGAAPQQLFAALNGSDTRIVGSDAAGTVWVLELDRSVRAVSLYRHGAMFVSGTVLPAGCAAWFRTRA